MLNNFEVVVGRIDGVDIRVDLLDWWRSGAGNAGKSLDDFKAWFLGLGIGGAADAPSLEQVKLALAKEAGFDSAAAWLASLKPSASGGGGDAPGIDEVLAAIATAAGYSSPELWRASLKGERGERGEAGSDGLRGEQGEAGADGQNGKDAVIPEFSVGSVTTLDAGESAAVVLTKQGDGYSFELRLPKGSDGAPGKDGTAGTGTGGEVVLKTYNGRNTEDLKNPGVYIITNGGALSDMGFPGAQSGILTVQANATKSIVLWQWTVPRIGLFASNSWINNRWQGWHVVKAPALQESLDYARDAVVTLGDSTMGLLKDGVTAEAAKRGMVTVPKAFGGTFARWLLVSLGGGLSFTFKSGEIPAKGGGTVDVEATMPDGEWPLNGQVVELSNGVQGQITRSGTAYKWTTYSNQATPVPVDDQPYAARLPLWDGHQNGICIISTAKNDLSTNATAESLQPIINKIVDALKPTGRARYIICTQWANNNASEPQRTQTEAFNAWLRKRYGLRVFDMEAYLMSEAVWTDTGITPNEQDKQAQAAKKLPVSLSGDGGAHLNTAANNAVAAKMIAQCVSLGFIA